MTSDLDLSSLTTAQGFSIAGGNLGDNSGYSVSGAGDVNGDGYADVIIGAHLADPHGRSQAGISYVIFGSLSSGAFNNINLANLSTDQGFAVYGAQAGDYSGCSVSGAGDVNGDSYDDIIIGALLANPKSRIDAGASYVVFGKASGFSNIDLASLTTAQGFAIYGAVTNDFSGCSVSEAGDVNGDGYADIIIGAYLSDPHGRAQAGTSYVVFGKASGFSNVDLASLTTEQGFSIAGDNPGEYSGYSVSGAGDVNGDSYDDIIIGAYLADPYIRLQAGTSYVVFGKASGFSNIDLASLTTAQGFAIYGAVTNDYSGWSVSGAGDVDGDGYDDIITGAYSANSNGKLYAGTSYVIFGKVSGFSNIDLASLTTTQGFAIYGAVTNDYSGIAVSGAGDVNGDGCADIIIGASGNSTATGKSYVLLGSNHTQNIFLSGLPLSQGFTIYGTTKADRSGWSVSGTGDLNGDGYADIIIGAYGVNSNTGESYVIYGAESGFVTSSPTPLPTGSPTSVPTTLPSAKPTIIPTPLPTFLPTEHPTSFPSTSPTSEPSSEPTSYPTGEPTSSPTGYPTSNPTSHPTSEPTKPRVLNQNIDYNFGTQGTILSTLGSAVGTFLMYKFMLRILDKWGYSYKLICGGREILADNEIGLYLSTINEAVQLIAFHKQKNYQVEINSGNNARNGIDHKLYDIIVEQLNQENSIYYPHKNIRYIFNKEDVANLKNDEFGIQYSPNFCSYIPLLSLYNYGKLEIFYKDIHNLGDVIKKIPLDIETKNNDGVSLGIYRAIIKEYNTLSKSNFLISEENQLRDFLLTDERIHYNLMCGFIPSYSDLGSCKGFLYYVFYNFLKQIKIHHEVSRTDIRISKDSFSAVYDVILSKIKSIPTISVDNPMSDSGVLMQAIEEVRNSEFLEQDKVNGYGGSLLSIDAMIDLEHVRLQNEDFTNFVNHLTHFITEDLPQNIELSIKSIQSKLEEKFIEEAHEAVQTVSVYQPSLKDNNIFTESNNFVLSLISMKQILHNLPLFHHTAQNSLHYLGYNMTLPDPLDNKAALISIDLILGNLAAQYLPAESIMNAMFVSTASSISFAARLIAYDYLSNQEISDEPIEFAQQCGMTIAAHSLPSIVNYAFAKAFLPNSEMSVSTLDMLATSSFGVIQCYNNYKAAYGIEAASSTLNTVVPYIADALTLWSLKDYMTFDTSSVASLTVSIKNAMHVAATTYAVHCVSDVVMDFMPQGVQEYIDTVFSYVTETATDVIDNLYDTLSDGIIV